MNSLTDKIKELRLHAQGSWDFDSIIKSISELQSEITQSNTIDLQKQRFLVVAETMLKEVEERRTSPEHMLHALENSVANTSTLSNEQGNQLLMWFFKVVNAGYEPTPFNEIAVRTIAEKFQNNAGTNKSRMLRDFEKFSRLAEIGPDPARSERNLRTMMVAARVNILPLGFKEEIISKCNAIIDLAKQRKSQPASILLQSSLDRCRALVDGKWQEQGSGNGHFLEQGISGAIHISLFGIEDILGQNGDSIEDIGSFRDELDTVRGKFAQVRYPSSSTIKIRLLSEIRSISQSLAGGYDFSQFNELARQLRAEAKASKRGQRGVNWMHEDHVAEILSELDDLDHEIRTKMDNTAALEAEMKLLESKVAEAKKQSVPLSPGLIRRLGQYVKKEAPLVQWIYHIVKRSGDQVWHTRLNGLRDDLKFLWKRMEEEEEKRIASFLSECGEVKARIAGAVDLRGMLQEIMELRQSSNDFTHSAKRSLMLAIDDLFGSFRKRVCDCQALSAFIKEIHQLIDASHRRIYSKIDFDDLKDRSALAMQWVQLRDFPRTEKQIFFGAARRVENEISKLQFRQETAFREREQRGQGLMQDFAKEIESCVELALAAPKNPEHWMELVDLDHQLRVNWRTLGDERGEILRAKLNNGFEQVKAARTQFAIEAGRVFAQYSEILNDTLFALEEESSREMAMSAIDRIKPLRAALRTETRLLKHHRQELVLLLNNVSSAIDEVFEQSNKASSQETNRIKLDIERLEQTARSAKDWSAANAVIGLHKTLSAKIREANLSIAGRRELRIEMLRVWEVIEARLDEVRSSRSREERVDDAIRRLERQGYLLIVSGGEAGVPSI